MHSATDLYRISLYYHSPAVRTHNGHVLCAVAVERQVWNIHFPEKQTEFISFSLLSTPFKWEGFSPVSFCLFSLSLRPLFSMSTNCFVAQGLWVILKAMDLRDTEDFNAHCHWMPLYCGRLCYEWFHTNCVCGNFLFVANMVFRLLF